MLHQDAAMHRYAAYIEDDVGSGRKSCGPISTGKHPDGKIRGRFTCGLCYPGQRRFFNDAKVGV